MAETKLHHENDNEELDLHREQVTEEFIPNPDGGVPYMQSALDFARSTENQGAARGLLLSLGWLDRLLSIFIIIAMILGVVIGEYASNARERLQSGDFEGVSAPLVVGMIMMMWPILTNVRYEKIPRMTRTWRLWNQIGFSLGVNWIIAPFVMLALAWATLPDLPGYRTGVIMVGIARCVAMVMVWNRIARGDTDICAILVIINSILQLVLYAPFAIWFVRVISGDDKLQLSYSKVATAVGIYLGIPLGAGILTRFSMMKLLGTQRFAKRFLPYFAPLSLISLLYVIIVIFASQSHKILHNLGPVFRTIVPLVLYFMIMWAMIFVLVSILSARYGKTHWGYQLAVVQAFTAASNNFELAIAVCVATYGADSDQALASTIGPLVEVPVLLALSWLALYLGRFMRWDKRTPRTSSLPSRSSDQTV
ncbi:arsenicals resistance [Malassezia yamatoensis]|uniref:Arsenicals resistance n=1 Tax=Malassezia yamatoensis TaxID=253288 RepID=A0AAJ6CIP1_9BASI|nr:arsenicals resistance [Malassezia yamatoensis]